MLYNAEKLIAIQDFMRYDVFVDGMPLLDSMMSNTMALKVA